MNKLELFRLIGANYAIVHFYTTTVPEIYFRKIATDMYPINEQRQEWALANMLMFYTQEDERMTIMKRLSEQLTTEPSLLDSMRQPKA